MKIIQSASSSIELSLTKEEWIRIGEKANWAKKHAPEDKKTFSLKETMKIAEAIGINWDFVKFTPEQFHNGLLVEQEHNEGNTDIVGPYTELGKITWAHLKEDPKYYSKLKKMEDSK